MNDILDALRVEEEMAHFRKYWAFTFVNVVHMRFVTLDFGPAIHRKTLMGNGSYAR